MGIRIECICKKQGNKVQSWYSVDDRMLVQNSPTIRKSLFPNCTTVSLLHFEYSCLTREEKKERWSHELSHERSHEKGHMREGGCKRGHMRGHMGNQMRGDGH